MLRYAIATAIGAALLAAPTLPAHAGVTVAGTLVLDKTSRPSPPEQSRGYVARTPHPLVTGKPMENPFPSMFVVLTGGDVGDEGKKPNRRPVDLFILGHKFSRAVFPVMVGQLVVLKNMSKQTSNKGVTPRIDAPGNRDIFDNPGDAGNPLNPTGERELKIKKTYKPIELRDLDLQHLKTKLVGVPHKYFAAPNGAGRFEIADVPAGTWTARVWYDNGWLEGADTKVEIPAAGKKKTLTIKVPPAMTVKAAE